MLSIQRLAKAGFAALALFGMDPAQTASAATKIVVNQSAQSLSASAVYLARHVGFFGKQDLDVDFVVTGSGLKSIVPLINGNTQFCVCVFSHPIDAMQANAGDVKVIGQLITGYNHKVVIAKAIADEKKLSLDMPLETRVRMLKGLKVGITEPNASTDQVIRLLMQDAGLDASRDAILIALGSPNLPPAIANKQIDAYTMTPPIPERAVAAGDAAVLVDLSKDRVRLLHDSLYMTISADPKWMAGNRPVAIRFMRAVAEAQKWLAANPAEARKILKEKEFRAMDQATFDASFEGYRPFFLPTPAVSRQAVDTGIELAQRFSKAPISVTYDRLVDESIAKEVSGSQ